ncbi:ROK family transcriptional regulator [Desertibacillus haloalkaliphilus]|uniref:ROK family transcriptional regulator n=1 Tax=Desertibacillus haloalkaliphilus TaxID=1328930 RepID=UPI001C276C16|nr:ROK family transcriptional regulator [Desertibacillus haloalkaliphilus]MBU8906332.1 ROK family protein [Desertibacillus haloalkaliphilus]
MRTGDASYIKKMNRKILIEEIIKNSSLSRSDLARITGLNKATVSAQINDLLNEQIVRELSEGESTTRGRKPILIEINESAGFSIGMDIDDDHINIIFTNLKGKPFHQFELTIEHYDLDQITEQLINELSPLIKKYKHTHHPIGLVGIGGGIHGIVNNDDEIIFTPKQQWSNIYISDKLEDAFQTRVYIENNANLSVFAEQVYDEYLSNLFCVTLHSGIGLGIVSENNIYHGYQGFAGEIGHMIIESNGRVCTCGNQGCWELYASENALKKKLSEKDPSLSLDNLPTVLTTPKYKQIFDDYLDYLAFGLNNIINIFNPEKLIINGSIINHHSALIEEISAKLNSKINNYRILKISSLGKDACVLGGASLALKHFYDVNVIHFANYDYDAPRLLGHPLH